MMMMMMMADAGADDARVLRLLGLGRAGLTRRRIWKLRASPGCLKKSQPERMARRGVEVMFVFLWNLAKCIVSFLSFK